MSFGTGRTTANLALAAVGKNGYVDFYNASRGALNLSVDLHGYFQPGVIASGHTTLAPTGLLPNTPVAAARRSTWS